MDGVLSKTDSIDRDAVPTQWTYSITNGKELFGIKNCVLEDVYNIDSTTCFGQTNIGFNRVNSTSTAHGNNLAILFDMDGVLMILNHFGAKPK